MSADTQIRSFFQRWERLEGEKKAISDDLKELFSEAKHAGYDSKALRAAFNRKVKQDAETTADQQFDMVVDTYLDAINGVARDARMRARENIEEFYPETGEVFEPNPRFIKQVVVGMQTEAGRAALIAAVDILIEQEDAEESRANVEEGAADESAAVSVDPASRTSEDSERQRASMVGFADDCRTGGKEQSAAADAPVGDAGAYAEGIPVSNGSRPADPAVSGGEPGKPSSDAGGEKMELGANQFPGRRDVKSLHSNAESEQATKTNSEIDPNEDREEGHSLDGNADANAGGGHVNAQGEAAQRAGALVKPAPAQKPLRPHCQNPGEHCGGYGSHHCSACLRASKETEVAA